MERILPSEEIGKKQEGMLIQGLGREGSGTTALARLGVERIVQGPLEQKVTDYMERKHYQRRRPEREYRGYRNGHEPGRIRMEEGEAVVQVPQVRDAPQTYRPEQMKLLRRHSDSLERLTVEMCARYLSMRDIQDALGEVAGDRLLSRSAVSQVNEVLWSDNSLREQAEPEEGILVAWGIHSDRCKVLLRLALGNKDLYTNWLDFLRDIVRRRLWAPVLVNTDGSPGLARAVKEAFPNSLRQPCLAHKSRHVLDKAPNSAQAEVKAMIQAAYCAPNQAMARMIVAQIIETYQDPYPSAMKSLQDDWVACLACLRCPAVHHKRTRTTNLLEQSPLEQRRRTKVIPQLFVKMCLKLVFATLWHASGCWRGVKMSDSSSNNSISFKDNSAYYWMAHKPLLRPRNSGLLHDLCRTFLQEGLNLTRTRRIYVELLVRLSDSSE